MIRTFKQSSIFRKLLLIVGVAALLIGSYLIQKLYASQGQISWPMVHSIFMILFLLLLILHADANESVKAELKEFLMLAKQENQVLRQETEKRLVTLKKIK